MYSLPMSTYSDYWRTTKSWSKYLGGAVVLGVGTTVLYVPEFSFPHIYDNAGSALWEETAAVPASRSEVMEVNVQIEDYTVPYETEYQESQDLLPGMSRVEQEGIEGSRRKVIRTVSIGGEEDRQMIYQFQLASPKKKVIVQNSQPVTGEQLDINKLNISRSFQGEATAYTYTGYCTASGLYPRVGLVAVDPGVIPLGTMLYIEGYGYAVAADTGGAIKGHIIDVFFNTVKECVDWGRRPVQIYILESKK